ncbi:hypothetical protein [Agaribacter flavus]|uniref:Transposase n=1 Tax=Agaribacter flavus TaxID=1902781 RepID=A0ABV7FPI9_9ALTE
MTIIACITDTIVVQKILAHLDKTNPVSEQISPLPPLRAPPEGEHNNDFSRKLTVQRDFDFGA